MVQNGKITVSVRCTNVTEASAPRALKALCGDFISGLSGQLCLPRSATLRNIAPYASDLDGVCPETAWERGLAVTGTPMNSAVMQTVNASVAAAIG
jgi:hypothetical protein